jgi:hypothetical protein
MSKKAMKDHTTVTQHLHHLKAVSSTAREKLREAIEAVEAAEIAHAKSIEAHARAKTMHDAAKADVASFADLDSKISHHNAGKLRVAIATGDAAPDLGTLPVHMAEAKAKRALAVEKLAAIGAVHAELAEDLKTSAKAVDLQKYQLDIAVESVVSEDVKEMADEWLADLADLQRRFWIFDALNGRRIRNHPEEPVQHCGTGNRPWKLDTSIHQIAIRSRGVLTDDAAAGAIAEQQSKAVMVGEYIQELRRNPEAKL